MSKLITIDYDEYLEMERVYKIYEKVKFHKVQHTYNSERREFLIGDRNLFQLLVENDDWAKDMDKVVISKDGYF